MLQNFEADTPNGANYVPLSPVAHLNRAAKVHSSRPAVVYGESRYDYATFADRVRRIAGGLIAHGITKGDTVSVIAPNIPELFELHFAVPMTGAVLNTINTRLEAETIAYIFDHADTKLVIADSVLLPLVSEAFDMRGKALPCILIRDKQGPNLSLIHISEPTRLDARSRMPSSA